MVDFHSHILPGMDDGSEDVSQSLRMLEMYDGTNVDTIVATPHYYIKDNSVEQFISKRERQYELLVNEIEKRNIKAPKIIKGCEIAAFHGMCMFEELDKLCIEGTDALLLELPFKKWGEWVFRELTNISDTRGFTPIIAHIERYVDIVDTFEDFRGIFSTYSLIQVNAGAIIKARGKGIIKKFVQNNIIQLLGSDCHDDTERAPNIGEAMKLLEKVYGKELVETIEYAGKSILSNTPFELPAPRGIRKGFF